MDFCRFFQCLHARPEFPSAAQYAVLLLIIILSVTAFGTRLGAQEANLVWPSPPEEPKIQYLRAFKSTLDMGGKQDRTDALQKPYGVAVDAAGRAFVTDEGRVMYFDPGKRVQGYLGDKPGPGKLREPVGIAVSRDGRIFVTDISADMVFVYSAGGALLGTMGAASELDTPSGIAVDDTHKKVYVVDSKKHRVNVYSLDGYAALGVIGSRGIDKEGRFNFPTNAAVDSRGNLYVADTGNFRVQVFDKNGKFVRSIGKLGVTAGSFARPKGIAVDSENHLYVADAVFQNVQIFDAEGRLLLSFAKGGWGPGFFTLPAGVAIDSRDRIYIVDQWPGNVQVFQYLGKRVKENPVSSTAGERRHLAGVNR